MSIRMSLFMALYGYDAPNMIDMLMSDSKVTKAKDFIEDHQDILRVLKDNIQ